jgi:hypothetical protein
MANEITKELELLGASIVNNMRRTLTTKGINASGTLSNSIQAEVNSEPNQVDTLNILMADYGTVVDEGRRPSRQKGYSSKTTGFFASLKDWVGKKLGIRGKQQLPVTYAIYNKINKRGYKPNPFIDSSIRTAVNQRQDKINDAAFRTLINNTDATLKKYYKK